MNRFHIFNRGQVNLMSRIMTTGRKFRMWPTPNGGIALTWQSKTGLSLAAIPSGYSAMKVYACCKPIDNWSRGSGCHGIDPIKPVGRRAALDVQYPDSDRPD